MTALKAKGEEGERAKANLWWSRG